MQPSIPEVAIKLPFDAGSPLRISGTFAPKKIVEVYSSPAHSVSFTQTEYKSGVVPVKLDNGAFCLVDWRDYPEEEPRFSEYKLENELAKHLIRKSIEVPVIREAGPERFQIEVLQRSFWRRCRIVRINTYYNDKCGEPDQIFFGDWFFV